MQITNITPHLIISADDFGFTIGTNQAIRHLIALGTVTATNVMANMPHANSIGAVAEEYPEISIGVHVNLTQGTPVSPPEQIQSLVAENGQFYSPHELTRRLLRGRIMYADCVREIAAQVNCTLELANGRIDHWNSHQGIHRYEPIATAAINVCRRAGIMGMRTHRHCFVDVPVGKQPYQRKLMRLIKETYYRILSWRAERYFFMPDALLATRVGSTLDTIDWVAQNQLPEGIWELVCHPATTVEELYGTTLLDIRVQEYECLFNPSIQAAINASATLTNFSGAASMRGKEQ